MQNEQKNTNTMNTISFYMTKTIKANGEKFYQVKDNTGKVHATRTSGTRDYVAAIFYPLKPEQTNPGSIVNGIGRIDLIRKALRTYTLTDAQDLEVDGITMDGTIAIAYLKEEPKIQEPQVETTDDQDQDFEKVRCSIVVLSHRNDYNIDGNGSHLEFADYLEATFPDQSVLINPVAEWSAWEATLDQDHEPEPQGPGTGSNALDQYREKSAQTLAEHYINYQSFTTNQGKIALGFWDWMDQPGNTGIYTRQVEERAMEIILEAQEQAQQFQELAAGSAEAVTGLMEDLANTPEVKIAILEEQLATASRRYADQLQKTATAEARINELEKLLAEMTQLRDNAVKISGLTAQTAESLQIELDKEIQISKNWETCAGNLEKELAAANQAMETMSTRIQELEAPASSSQELDAAREEAIRLANAFGDFKQKAQATITGLNEAGNGEAAALLAESSKTIQEQEKQLIRGVEIIRELQAGLINAQKTIQEQAARILELEKLLQDTQVEIQDIMKGIQAGDDFHAADLAETHQADLAPELGPDPGLAISDVLAAIRSTTLEGKIFELYLEHARAAGYPAGMILEESVFTQKILEEGAIAAGGKVWRLADHSHLMEPTPESSPASTQRPIAEQQANLARRLQLLDDIRILEECGLIAISDNLGQPFLEAPVRTPDEGDKAWIAKQ
jgi:hypothetical protein